MQALHDLISTIDAFTWISVAGLVHLFISGPTAIHVLMNKHNERAAVSWIGLILLSPFLGSIFYWLFGMNRVKRKAQTAIPSEYRTELRLDKKPGFMKEIPGNWQSKIILGFTVHQSEFTLNNTLSPMINGDEAYPAMLEAINGAQNSIVLSSYIFVYDAAGEKFVEALAKAHQRGVEVRVLIDGIGIDYGWHKTDRALHKHGVKTARFLPTISFSGTRFINLRNHRKILSIDGHVAFIGGMNISCGNLLKSSPRRPVQDIHFMIEGPVIDQINRVFTEDWLFAAGETLHLPTWKDHGSGTVIGRILPSGPDADHEKLKWLLIGAINCAQNTIRIVTPYFIPGTVLLTALQAASLRGVAVEIIVPGKSNIPFFDWAMMANLFKLISFGIHLYKSPAPFDHSKFFLVDDIWSFIGSSNWDERSLTLNFEVNMECFDRHLNTQLTELFERKKSSASLAKETGDGSLAFLIRFRNNIFRLLSPYL